MSTRRRRASSRRGGRLAGILVLAAASCGGQSGTAIRSAPPPPRPALARVPTFHAPSGPAGPAIPNFSHVAVVLMENHEFRQVIGSPSAPYLNTLASTYG